MSLITVLSSIGGIITSIKSIIDSFFVKHPAVKNVADGTVKAGLVGGLTYVADTLSPGSSTAITATGIGAAALVAVKTYAQHQADTFVANTLNGLTGASTALPVPQTVSPTASPVAIPAAIPEVSVAQAAQAVVSAALADPVQALTQAQSLIGQHTTSLAQSQVEAQKKIDNLASAAKQIADVVETVTANISTPQVK